MTQQVRIDEAAHATLRELAEKDKVSMQEQLGRAIECYRRERFFAELHTSFARMSPADRAAYQAEVAVFDHAHADGLEAEDWTGFDVASQK